MLQFGDYIEFLINGIPHNVYVLALVVFCIGSALLLLILGWNRSLRYCMGLLLSEYVILIYCSTVFFRSELRARTFDFTPFWSYGVERLIPENIMNVVIFVPVGVLLGFVVNGTRFTVRKGWLVAICVGMGLSVGIEALQFVLKRGFSEVDDVMHNTLGCMIGYSLWLMVHGAWSHRSHRSHR